MVWTTSYYHYDALGSTCLFTDGSQAISNEYMYDAYGNEVSASGPTANPFRYVGELGYYFDADTETINVRARYYQPSIIRWLSQDPIRFDGIDPSLYLYARSSPTVLSDPTGLCSGEPNGSVFVDNRGKFTLLGIGQVFHERPPSFEWLETNMEINWRPDPDSFKDTNDCGCCCENIGFIQTVKEEASYDQPFSTYSLPWLIDKAIPYPKGPRPSTDPCDEKSIQLRDRPGAPKRWHGIGAELLRLRQQFWTCAVCLKGNEGLVKVDRLLGGGELIIETLITGVTVYGCVSWEHSIVRKANGQYEFKRRINSRTVTGDNSVGFDLSSAPNLAPPAEWSDAVRAGAFR